MSDPFDIFGLCYFCRFFLLKPVISKTTSLRYVSDKVPSAKLPHKPGENIDVLRTAADPVKLF